MPSRRFVLASTAALAQILLCSADGSDGLQLIYPSAGGTTWTIPASCAIAQADLVGAGGGGGSAQAGGDGARVSVTFGVTSSTTVVAYAGGGGAGADASINAGAGGAASGIVVDGALLAIAAGGGGGSASDLLCPQAGAGGQPNGGSCTYGGGGATQDTPGAGGGVGPFFGSAGVGPATDAGGVSGGNAFTPDGAATSAYSTGFWLGGRGASVGELAWIGLLLRTTRNHPRLRLLRRRRIRLWRRWRGLLRWWRRRALFLRSIGTLYQPRRGRLVLGERRRSDELLR